MDGPSSPESDDRVVPRVRTPIKDFARVTGDPEAGPPRGTEPCEICRAPVGLTDMFGNGLQLVDVFPAVGRTPNGIYSIEFHTVERCQALKGGAGRVGWRLLGMMEDKS